MAVVLLVLSFGAFAVAVVSIRHPEAVKSWMRAQSTGILPDRLREIGYELAPVAFALGGIGFGVLFLLSALSVAMGV